MSSNPACGTKYYKLYIMEDKKDYKQQNIQKFYFNEDGQLVVESNKGVWVDGTPYVKMYGNFTCNAKTMGIVIEKFKGIKVDVEMSTEDGDTFLKMYTERLQEIEKLKGENTCQIIEIAKAKDKTQSVEKKVIAFNSLPWYKRIFKKIEIKTN